MALKAGKNVLFNAFIYYTKLKQPALKYGMQAGKAPHVNREYVVDVLVTEEDYKKLKKKYRNVKAIKDAKEFDGAKEFEDQFKVAPPYDAETYYVVKFKKSADYQDGNATPKPVVKAAKGCGKPVTIETEIGNGTEAHVQWREREWTYKGTKGLSLDLAAVGVVDLIEYTGGGLELEFDEEDDFDDEIGFEEDSDEASDYEGDSSDADQNDDEW